MINRETFEFILLIFLSYYQQVAIFGMIQNQQTNIYELYCTDVIPYPFNAVFLVHINLDLSTLTQKVKLGIAESIIIQSIDILVKNQLMIRKKSIDNKYE